MRRLRTGAMTTTSRPAAAENASAAVGVGLGAATACRRRRAPTWRRRPSLRPRRHDAQRPARSAARRPWPGGREPAGHGPCPSAPSARRTPKTTAGSSLDRDLELLEPSGRRARRSTARRRPALHAGLHPLEAGCSRRWRSVSRKNWLVAKCSLTTGSFVASPGEPATSGLEHELARPAMRDSPAFSSGMPRGATVWCTERVPSGWTRAGPPLSETSRSCTPVAVPGGPRRTSCARHRGRRSRHPRC